MCQLLKKIHHLEHTQYAFLNHSKTLVFSDIIEIEIVFKYSHTHASRNYSYKLYLYFCQRCAMEQP